MKKQRITYVAFYDRIDSTVKRLWHASAVSKIDAVCRTLTRAGFDVDIVSTSGVTEPKLRLYKGKTQEIAPGVRLRTFFSWGGRGTLLGNARSVWHLLCMFTYLLRHCGKNDTVLAYHSPSYFCFLRLAHKLKKFRLILEVEEIYQDVADLGSGARRRSEKRNLAAADAYLFSTQALNERINTHKLPYAVCLGTYHAEPQHVQRFPDGKIHVVYAGTFSPDKGGAASAIDAALHLPENYHLHICGFGKEHEISAIRQRLDRTAIGAKAATYHGLLLGPEITLLLQQCHIGLNTQNPSAAFNASSFPSKILKYMANGLTVVSCRTPVLTASAVGGHLTYYNEQEPAEIARAIMAAPLDTGSRELLDRLDRRFTAELRALICGS